MKQLTRLRIATLYRVTKIPLSNGDIEEQLTNIGNYKIITQELNDAVSATVYGADINKVLRIASVNKVLEILLKEKLNNTADNISKYRISYDNTMYKITDVKTKYIDIERL